MVFLSVFSSEEIFNGCLGVVKKSKGVLELPFWFEP